MIDVVTTGREDRAGPWSIAICGYPGAGKSLFATTAPDPLFVFFHENPPLKSIAPRAIPHVKLFNKVSGDTLEVSVQDQMLGLYTHLLLEKHDYQTLVIDTGDELFMEIKAARRLANRGQFGPGDWDWLADTYREVVTSLIDLPMNVMVLFHLKSTTLEDEVVRELALQGSAKDEAAQWFDVVSVLETYERTDEAGQTQSRRALLSHSSSMYPWVKDHSGTMPRFFDVSDDFVGDYGRLMALLEADLPVEGRQVVESVGAEQGEDASIPAEIEVPSPEQLDAEKKKTRAKAKPEKLKVVEPEPEPESEPEPEPGDGEQAETLPEPVEDAQALLEQEFAAEKVEANPYWCQDCLKEGKENVVDDEDVRDLSQIAYRANLCRDHFKARRAKEGSGR